MKWPFSALTILKSIIQLFCRNVLNKWIWKQEAPEKHYGNLEIRFREDYDRFYSCLSRMYVMVVWDAIKFLDRRNTRCQRLKKSKRLATTSCIIPFEELILMVEQAFKRLSAKRKTRTPKQGTKICVWKNASLWKESYTRYSAHCRSEEVGRGPGWPHRRSGRLPAENKNSRTQRYKRPKNPNTAAREAVLQTPLRSESASRTIKWLTRLISIKLRS